MTEMLTTSTASRRGWRADRKCMASCMKAQGRLEGFHFEVILCHTVIILSSVIYQMCYSTKYFITWHVYYVFLSVIKDLNRIIRYLKLYDCKCLFTYLAQWFSEEEFIFVNKASDIQWDKKRSKANPPRFSESAAVKRLVQGSSVAEELEGTRRKSFVCVSGVGLASSVRTRDFGLVVETRKVLGNECTHTYTPCNLY